MKKEIERKYLLRSDVWQELRRRATDVRFIQQSYLVNREELSIRVRLVDNKGYLTLKIGKGKIRDELEIEINYDDAVNILKAQDNCIQKHRYQVGRFEIDSFDNFDGELIIAEIELMDDNEEPIIPTWMALYLVDEVTNISKYSNGQLALNL